MCVRACVCECPYNLQCLEHQRFSEASDVWSTGVLMWEIWSQGRLPYPGMTNQVVIAQVVAGYRMAPPYADSPSAVYALMMSCWYANFSQRPTFTALKASLRAIAVNTETNSPQANKKDFPVKQREPASDSAADIDGDTPPHNAIAPIPRRRSVYNTLKEIRCAAELVHADEDAPNHYLRDGSENMHLSSTDAPNVKIGSNRHLAESDEYFPICSAAQISNSSGVSHKKGIYEGVNIQSERQWEHRVSGGNSSDAHDHFAFSSSYSHQPVVADVCSAVSTQPHVCTIAPPLRPHEPHGTLLHPPVSADGRSSSKLQGRSDAPPGRPRESRDTSIHLLMADNAAPLQSQAWSVALPGRPNESLDTPMHSLGVAADATPPQSQDQRNAPPIRPNKSRDTPIHPLVAADGATPPQSEDPSNMPPVRSHPPAESINSAAPLQPKTSDTFRCSEV
jgi:hypothetical protein